MPLVKKQSFSATPADLQSVVVMSVLDQTNNLLAYSAPVPFLYLAHARIHPVLVKFENGLDISSMFDLATFA